MTALKDHLINVIKLHGPIPISSYMTEVLTNPKYGYYVKENPFGSSGDFVTAPEVSQMFGELIGLWFADVWLKMGSPKKVNLIELGPGNGTFIKDFIR
ncbi:MAG: SAM-dependent methyltransferase, partial [Emcibacteraceae bacterium]|nr:SAM-dependent methyltransferase [Emcibacteraceae bacterium]